MEVYKIDGYHGVYNGINYCWHDKKTYAVISFLYDGKELSREVGNITGPYFNMDIIDDVSEMEINLAIEEYKANKRAEELLKRVVPHG